MQISEIILYVILFIILVVVSLVIAKLYNGGKESFAVGGGRRLKKLRKLKKRKRYHGGAAFVKTVGANAAVDNAVQPIIANVVNYDAAGHKQTGDELVAYANQLKLFSDAWVPIDDDPNNVGGPAGPMHTADGVIDTNVGAILTAIAELDRLNAQTAITQQESQDYATAVTDIKNASTIIKAQTLVIKDHINDLDANAAGDVAKQTELAGIMAANGLTAQQVQQLTAATAKENQLDQTKQQIGKQIQNVNNAKPGLNKTLVAANQLVIDKRKASDEASAKKAAATGKKITKATSDAATADAEIQKAVVAATAAQKAFDDNATESKQLTARFKQNQTDIDDVTVLLGQLNDLLKPPNLLARCQAADTAANALIAAANVLTMLAVQAAPQPVVPVAPANPVPVQPAAVAPAVVLGLANEADLLYLSSFIEDTAVLVQLINDTLPNANKTAYNENLLGNPVNTADTKYDLNNANFKHSQEVIESVNLTITAYFEFLNKTKELYTQGLLTPPTAANIFALNAAVKNIIDTYYVFAQPITPPKLSGIVLFNQARINDIDTIFNTIKTKAIPLLNNEITTQAAPGVAAPGGALFQFTGNEFDAAFDALKLNSVTPWYPRDNGGQTDYYKTISEDRIKTVPGTTNMNGILVKNANRFRTNASYKNTTFDTNNVSNSMKLPLFKYNRLKNMAPITNNLANVTTDFSVTYTKLLLYIDYIGRFLEYIFSIYGDPNVHDPDKVQTISVAIQKLVRQTKLTTKLDDIKQQKTFQKYYYGLKQDGSPKQDNNPNPTPLEYDDYYWYDNLKPDIEKLKLPQFGGAATDQFRELIRNLTYIFRELLTPSIVRAYTPLPNFALNNYKNITAKVPVDSGASIYKLDNIMTAIVQTYEIWRYGIAAVECSARTNDNLVTETDSQLTIFLQKYNNFQTNMINGSIANPNTFKALKDDLFDAFKQFRWKLMSKRPFQTDENGPDDQDEKQLYSNLLLIQRYTSANPPQPTVIGYNAYYDKIQEYLRVPNGVDDVNDLIGLFNGGLSKNYNNVLQNGLQFNFPIKWNNRTKKTARTNNLNENWPNDNTATFRRIYELLVYNGSKIDTKPISQDHPPSLMTLFIQTLTSPELNIPKQIGEQLNIQATSFGPGSVGSTQPLVEPPPATVETPQFKTYTTQPTSSVSFTSLSEGSMLTVGDLKQTTGNVVVVADNMDDLNKKIQRIVDENAGSRNLYGLVVDMTGETAPLFKSVAIELGMKPPADIEKLLGDKRKSSRGWLYEIKEYPNGEFYLSIIAYIKPMEYQV